MHDFLVTVVAFLVLIGLMVIVHEFGHFIVAKLCRVRVEAFSFGFGPRLFGYKYGDTDYKVCLLPLGGFVKMTGEIPGEDATNDPGAFTSHPRWQRMLIGLAGPVANFVLAFVLLFVYYAGFNEAYSVHPATLEWVTPGSLADQSGFKPGDVIARFADKTNPDIGVLLDEMTESNGKTVPVTVLRNGAELNLSLALPEIDKGGDLMDAGFYPHIVEKPLTIDQIIPGSAAQAAGLRHGDQILSVDGYSFHTLEPLVDYLKAGKGKPIAITLHRATGVTETVSIQPREEDGVWKIGFGPDSYGDIPVRRAPITVGNAGSRAFDLCVEESKMIGVMIEKLLTRKASVKQLSGPVGIAVVAGKAAETHDWGSKFQLAAGISLNLGILNLLPFPILDGGMILFLLIESLLRRDISMAIKERIYQAAFVLIVVFFAFVIFNDISNLPLFARFK
jgi:regulator of sigma E protease